MNGKMYDPAVGRFLNADPYVQMPGNTQSYNRYSYCLNNPLRYTDPSGDMWSLITGVVDFFSTALFKGGLDPTSKSARQKAWRNYDPTASWSNTNKAWKIDMGLFKTDSDKDFWGRAGELLSRFTWQLPQTALGYTVSGTHNLLGGVKSVDYYGGATVVESYSKDWGAITLSNYINGQRGITADPDNRLFQHEYGHYLQSQSSGLFYLSKYGIPSLLSSGNHKLHPTEQDANARAFMYFNRSDDNYNDWDFGYNPINGYRSGLPFNDLQNQMALNKAKLSLSWYDYLLGPQILIPGIVNTFIQNSKQ